MMNQINHRPDEPYVSIGCVSNVYIRNMHFKKTGDTEQCHKHEFDHITVVASGSVNVTVNNKDTVFKAPQMIFIAKELMHELTALEDNTVCLCVHALRDKDTLEILDPSMIPDGVKATSLPNVQRVVIIES
jgi:quercetin dioxygenase-like cupin family protein